MSSLLHGCCDQNTGPHLYIASTLTHSPALFRIVVKDWYTNTENILVKSADGGKPGLLTNSEGNRVWGMNKTRKTYTTNKIQFNWAKHTICYLN